MKLQAKHFVIVSVGDDVRWISNTGVNTLDVLTAGRFAYFTSARDFMRVIGLTFGADAWYIAPVVFER